MFSKKHTLFTYFILLYWLTVAAFDLFCHFVWKETNSSRILWIVAAILFAGIILILTLWDSRKKK